jgi:DNA-binding response OmpR family regulator
MYPNPKILIAGSSIEDIHDRVSMIEEAGFMCTPVTDSELVIEVWSQEIPDLVVIEELREDISTQDIILALREISVVPILLLTDSEDEEHLLDAYRIGVDECITTPVSHRLFIAKVNALLKRARQMPIQGLDSVKVGDIALDPKRREVTLPSGTTKLTTLEFRLLFLLMQNPLKTLSYNEILEKVWGYRGLGNGVLVKNVIYRLRKKIEQNHNDPRYILTESGFGYRFEP